MPKHPPVSTQEAADALKRLMGYDARYDEDVKRILDAHAVGVAPVEHVAPLTDAEISAFRGNARKVGKK